MSRWQGIHRPSHLSSSNYSGVPGRILLGGLGSGVSIAQNNVIGVNSGQSEEPPRAMASTSGLGQALPGNSGMDGLGLGWESGFSMTHIASQPQEGPSISQKKGAALIKNNFLSSEVGFRT